MNKLAEHKLSAEAIGRTVNYVSATAYQHCAPHYHTCFVLWFWSFQKRKRDRSAAVQTEAHRQRQKERNRQNEGLYRKNRWRTDPFYRLDMSAKSTSWKLANMDIALAKRRDYEKRNKSNPIVRLKRSIRRHIQKAVSFGASSKRHSSSVYLGCTYAELRAHLESLWQPWMNWGNYGARWHIDHKLPLAAFDLQDDAQFRAACHFTNLQPLCAKLNMSKGKRML